MSEFVEVFSRASKVVRALIEGELRPHGLHLGQHRVLGMLWERDGQTPGAIAAALEVTTPTVVVMANRMAAAGLLVRRRDDPDNRLVRLYLTDAGRGLREPVEEALRRIEAQLTTGLSESERRTVTRVLDRVAENALRAVPVGTD